MKKIYFALMSLVMCLSLASCFSNPKNEYVLEEDYTEVKVDSIDKIIGEIEKNPNVVMIEEGEYKFVEMDDGICYIYNLKIIYDDAVVKDSIITIYEPYDAENSTLETPATKMVLPEKILNLMKNQDVSSAEIRAFCSEEKNKKTIFKCHLRIYKNDGAQKDTTIVLRTLK